MYEILFRAWDKTLKFMLYGDDIERDSNYHIGLSCGKLFVAYQNKKSDWDELEIMQYVGKKDKNGKEIYKGDIIQDYWKEKDLYIKAEVIWKGCGWKIKTNTGTYLLDESIIKGYEVVGNIYENPELLREVNDVR